MGLFDMDCFDDVRRMNKRQLFYQALNFGMIVSSALMIWKGLMVVTGSESPIVVVLSGSMEPAFYRGDLLFLTNYREEPIRVGEIVVFKIEGREIPIVHRVLKVHEKENGTVSFLTKGDNNSVDDRGLYAPGQLWLQKNEVVGRARGFVPYVGIVTILMNDYPKFKLFYQALNFGMVVSSALMIWKGLMVVTGSESPIVVVLRGDLLILTNYVAGPIRVEDIVVYKVKGREIPIVHRVLKVHEKEYGTVNFLTKGDNNNVDDRGLYAPDQLWLQKHDVVGRAKGAVPYIGIVTIVMNEYLIFKYALLACVGMFALIHRE